MKAQPTLVGSDRAVHLDPEPAVDVDLVFIVLPGNAEHDDALRFDNPLEDFARAVLRVTIEGEDEGLDHFLDRLMELHLARVLRFDPRHQLCNVIFHR